MNLSLDKLLNKRKARNTTKAENLSPTETKGGRWRIKKMTKGGKIKTGWLNKKKKRVT